MNHNLSESSNVFLSCAPLSVNQTEVQSLSERIKQLEGAIAQASPGREVTDQAFASTEEPGTASPCGRREPIPTTEGAINQVVLNPTRNPSESFARRPRTETLLHVNQLGPNWFFNGMPISSEAGRQWISTKTDQPVSRVEFCVLIRKDTVLPYLGSSPCDILELPDEVATRGILELYFKSSFRLAFPVLDEFLMEDTVRGAYSSTAAGDSYSTPQISAKACILAAISMASVLNLSRQTSNPIEADACASRAHCLLAELSGDISLTSLQTVILLQLQTMSNGHWQKASTFNSMACSMLCSLGGHIQQERKSPGIQHPRKERETRHIRMLFWVSYMLDKDIALRTGNPPQLTDTYCDLSLPEDYMQHYDYLSARQELHKPDEQMFKHLTPHLPGDPHLSCLKEKVCRNLFSARALKNDNNQLLLNIRQLDDEIEQWRLSIPMEFRPALFVAQSSQLNTLGGESPRFSRLMSLQLEYHHLMTVIHTTVRKCIPDAGDGYRDQHHVVHSSFDISLEASRSTLWCIKLLCTKATEGKIRFIMSYLTTAAMSLFLNIVIHPLDPQAQLDLEALMSVSNAVRKTISSDSTEDEKCRLSEASDFVMRLVWLGTSAVTKGARRT
ncbi:hypothetical protein N7452_010018 [Penicillium brevicompactum]|uniref:Xylanolytic transcriptional activator regulatory domain-containing protein n=1 Tax=Penicillium brevicompactum TaxID=5074 RepID=A0A9W9UB67_PENBR|nr:hypothetical protein N7452_010018 [Penicillium brevicompactum]